MSGSILCQTPGSSDPSSVLSIGDICHFGCRRNQNPKNVLLLRGNVKSFTGFVY